MPLAPGIRLGPYEVLAPLGAGGMGEVEPIWRRERVAALRAGVVMQNPELVEGSHVERWN